MRKPPTSRPFSVVTKSRRPRTTKQIGLRHLPDNCEGVRGHTRSEQAAEVPVRQRRNGTNTPPNIDGPGDMAFIAPKQNAKVTLKVTAKPGTTLYFICAVHPWMQAKLVVGR